jgi:hypothetical protein
LRAGADWRRQAWFTDAGFEPTALVVGEGGLFGVAAARLRGQPQELQPGVQLLGAFFR